LTAHFSHTFSDTSYLQRRRSKIIKQISDDFCEVATRHGKTIISEAFLPEDHPRTIPPVDAGGLAGGLKYLKDGIFFKFAVDNNAIYGGDHLAMKAAGHELKGETIYFPKIDCFANCCQDFVLI
jgi:hypothetical protein